MAAGLVYLGSVHCHPVLIRGSSMTPTLPDGTLIWLDRGWYRRHLPQPGEVVVFRHRGHTYVKRVYCGPGSTLHCVIDRDECMIPVREANYPTLRARLLSMSHKGKPHFRPRKLLVPEDCIYVLGDNLLQSVDSRALGFIPIRSLLGRARLPVDCTAGARGELSFPARRTGDSH